MAENTKEAEVVKTEAEVPAKVIETKVDVDGVTKYKCQFCGKWITKEENVENESGDYCRHLREQGFDDVALAEYRKERTVDEPPAGWIKTAALHKICQREGIPVSAMVRAFGGDRGLGEALRPEFQFVYSGRARWVDPWCATKDGLDFLRSIARTPANSVPTKEGEESKGGKKRVSVKKPVGELEAALAEA